jgi:hypothetical protein
MMGTEKRDALASQSVRWVSDALDELGNAQTALRDQNYKKVGEYLHEAINHLNHMCDLYAAACEEMQAETEADQAAPISE